MDCCNQEKHSKLIRPHWGEFGRNELGIKAKDDELVRQVMEAIMLPLSRKYKIAFADHRRIHLNNFFQEIVNIQFAFQGQSIQFNSQQLPNEFHRKTIFNEQDLVLVNANHLSAQTSIFITDNINPDENSYMPVFQANEPEKIIKFIENYLKEKTPKLNGLVLIGGKSTRMGKDKALLDYHGKPQKEYVHDLLSELCEEVYFSCRAEQVGEEDMSNKIEDRFVGMGPMGGILSAMMANPERAWLVVACDLPFIDKKSLQALVNQRNLSKIATSFLDSEGKFPEPLIAIWEPKSYPILYHFLSLGYSCPRKVLINSDIQLVKAPDDKALTNANEPQDYEKAKEELKNLD